MKVVDALQGVRRLALDTAPFIYYLEDHPTQAAKVDAVFQIVEAQGIDIKASTITLTEVLKKPLQFNDAALVASYRELLTETEFVELIPVTSTLADSAAQLRASYNLKTPDALHIASALAAECNAFLTNDRALLRIAKIPILLLDSLEID